MVPKAHCMLQKQRIILKPLHLSRKLYRMGDERSPEEDLSDDTRENGRMQAQTTGFHCKGVKVESGLSFSKGMAS